MITHEHPGYIALREKIGGGKYNGCYYYSKEIVENIIPHVKTKRDWNTVGRDLEGMHNGMIVFLHDNSTPWNYNWLKNYEDLVLICSSNYTMASVRFSGHTVFVPMSIDIKYVKRFRTKKTKDTCFVGNRWVKDNLRDTHLLDDENIVQLTSMPREKLLTELAKFHKAYAIDRCALEAKVLGCEVLQLDTRYHTDPIDRVVDNLEAADILQRELDKIDGGK